MKNCECCGSKTKVIMKSSNTCLECRNDELDSAHKEAHNVGTDFANVANKWIKKQLKLIDKYGEPKYDEYG